MNQNVKVDSHTKADRITLRKPWKQNSYLKVGSESVVTRPDGPGVFESGK